MRASRIAFLLAAVLVLAAGPARGQNTTIDSRWISYLGCWQSVGVRATTVCLLPVGQSSVDLVTIESGAVTSTERIVTGQRVSTARGECTGWQMAEWSAVSDRLYLQSEETCSRSDSRTANGLIALARDGSLLYIQGGTIGAKTGVQVHRYREGTNQELPGEVQDALSAIPTDLTATTKARATAMARLMVEDVAEASRQLEPDVVEAWLMERGGSISLDAERLVALANAGVPSSTIDVLVALAYPNAFAINGPRGQSQVGDNPPIMPMPTLGAFGACDLDFVFRYGSPYCGGFGGYGFSGYYPGYPYVIIYTGGNSGGGDGARRHGRVINGRGYREGQGATADLSRRGEPRHDAAGSSSGTSSTGTATPSSSSGSGEPRTAKPRP